MVVSKIEPLVERSRVVIMQGKHKISNYRVWL